MKLIKLGRTLREGWRNFYRDGWMSFATVSIIVLALYVLAITFFTITVGGVLVKNIQDRVNISAYFYPSVSEERILEIKKELEGIREVEKVEYVSREQALEDFKNSRAYDEAARIALEELQDTEDGNPFFASLVIKARDSADYDRLAALLKKPRYKEEIESVNYDKNQEIIDRLTAVVGAVKKIGLSLGAIFSLIAVLVVYNTVRMTMFVRRKEFEVMRLVGASNLYIGLPSLFEAILYGLVSSVVTMGLMALTMYAFTPAAKDVLFGHTLFGFFLSYFWYIFLITLTVSLLVSIFSSGIAIKRHLRV